MNKIILVVFLSLIALLGTNCLKVQDSVQVQVYYEALSPDSIAFIVNQLYPAFEVIGSAKIRLELIPWGFANETLINGTKTFECQHGAEECYANKVHACAIDAFDVNDSTKFIACAEGLIFPDNEADLEECAVRVGIAWCEINECLKTGRGDELLSEYNKKAAFLKPTYIPTIVVDGAYSDANQSAAEKHFKSFVCELLGNPTPECSS